MKTLEYHCSNIVLPVSRDPHGFTSELTSPSSQSPLELTDRFGPLPGMVLPFTGDLSLHRVQQVSWRSNRQQRSQQQQQPTVMCQSETLNFS